MSRNRFPDFLANRVSRRTMLTGTAALGVATATGMPKEVFARSQAATPEGGDYPEVLITGADYSFDMPATIEGGWTNVTFANEGMMDHHAIFLRVNDGATVEEVDAALALPEFGPVFGVATAVGGPNCGPGETTSVVMDLQPGQYVVICAIPNEEGVPHYALGMIAYVEVTEGTASAAAPEADAMVHLVDFAFHDMPMEATAGPAVWEIVNDGPQVHELVLNRLEPGVSFDMVIGMMTGGAVEGTPAAEAVPPESSPMAMEMAPPFVTVDGVAPMSAGETNWLMLDLEAGEYFMICYVPDPETGAPHFALGMVMPLTVT